MPIRLSFDNCNISENKPRSDDMTRSVVSSRRLSLLALFFFLIVGIIVVLTSRTHRIDPMESVFSPEIV